MKGNTDKVSLKKESGKENSETEDTEESDDEESETLSESEVDHIFSEIDNIIDDNQE